MVRVVKPSTIPVKESSPQFSLTGARRLAKETLAMENSGLRHFTGCKRFDAIKTQTAVWLTLAVITSKVDGLTMHGPLRRVPSTTVEAPSSSLGTTTMEGSQTSSHQAAIIAGFIYLRIPS